MTSVSSADWNIVQPPTLTPLRSSPAGPCRPAASFLLGGPGCLRADSLSVVHSQMESICFTWKCLGISPGRVSSQPTPHLQEGHGFSVGGFPARVGIFPAGCHQAPIPTALQHGDGILQTGGAVPSTPHSLAVKVDHLKGKCCELRWLRTWEKIMDNVPCRFHCFLVSFSLFHFRH